MEEEKKNLSNVRVKDHELFKIKLALSSLTNTVVVCPYIATLYTQSPSDIETWTCCKRGAPGLIVSHNEEKEIIGCQICITDPDSGFAVWRETLFENSGYKASQKNFHTFNLLSSGDDNTMAGIRFPSDESACIFLRDVLENIPKEDNTRPESPATPLSKSAKRLSKKIKKSEISSPCMFQHVTSINNRPRDRSKSTINNNSKDKISKHSGSGSSLDAPDSDPPQHVAIRRVKSLFNNR